MKRVFLLCSLLLLGVLASAQESKDDYLRRYNNLVERVGPSGLGVETLLNKWEADWPEDERQLLARFLFCFDRSRTSSIEELDQDRYLGREPLIPLTDSLGKKHNYFEVYDYDESLFADAILAIDKAIRIKPWQLNYRFNKIDALIAYEKESPDMALQELKSLVDKHFKEHPFWEMEGMDKVSDEQFKAFMQDYCFAFFRLGTPASAEAFKALSQHLLGYCKDDPMYLGNLGSYHLVRKEYKQALKYYDQVLKKHPGDMSALKNGVLAARAMKDVKLEKKYLTQMAKNGETEIDRASAQARLEALNRK